MGGLFLYSSSPPHFLSHLLQSPFFVPKSWGLTGYIDVQYSILLPPLLFVWVDAPAHEKSAPGSSSKITHCARKGSNKGRRVCEIWYARTNRKVTQLGRRGGTTRAVGMTTQGARGWKTGTAKSACTYTVTLIIVQPSTNQSFTLPSVFKSLANK